jgi:hypothetical protein
MTCTIGLWVIPLLLTLAMVARISRPYERRGDYDPGPIERVLWIVPILGVWLIYCIVELILK